MIVSDLVLSFELSRTFVTLNVPLFSSIDVNMKSAVTRARTTLNQVIVYFQIGTATCR